MMKKQFLLLFVALLMATLSSWAQTQVGFETGESNYVLATDGAATLAVSAEKAHTGVKSAKMALSDGSPSTDFAKITIDYSGLLKNGIATCWNYVPTQSRSDLAPYLYFIVDANGNGLYDYPNDGLVIQWMTNNLTNDAWFLNTLDQTSKVHVVGNRTGLGTTEFSSSNGAAMGTLADLCAKTFSGTTKWGDLPIIKVRTGAGEWPGASNYYAYVDDITIGLPAPTPITTIGTISSTTCGTFDVPVKVSDFKNVGAISMVLNFDPAVFAYQPSGVTLNSAILADADVNVDVPGQFKLGWNKVTGITLADDDVLFTLHFNMLPAVIGNTTNLTWSTNPGDCELAAPGGAPIYVSTFSPLAWTIPVRPVVNVNSGKGYCTIQSAIDAANSNETIKVYPGNYNETAPNSSFNGGIYQFGLFFPPTKSNITVEGCKADGTVITNTADIAAFVTTNATNTFGYAGTFVAGNNITLRGLAFGNNLPSDDKAIEVIGNGFTFDACRITANAPIYIGDYNYNENGTPSNFMDDVSSIQAYALTNCDFAVGDVYIANGAGWTGSSPASVTGRSITGCTFRGSAIISFSGLTPGTGWLNYPTGAATITGNTFTNSDPAVSSRYIQSWGVVQAEFPYSSYWNNNTFPKKTLTTIDGNPDHVRGYDASAAFLNLKRIGNTIQPRITYAQTGDVVLVGAGTYDEQVVIDSKSLTLKGAGMANTFISPSASSKLTSLYTYPAGTFWPGTVLASTILVKNSPAVTIKDLKIDGAAVTSLPAGAGRLAGILFGESSGIVDGVAVNSIKTAGYVDRSYGIDLSATSTAQIVEVKNTTVSDWGRNGIQAMGASLTANIHDNVLVGPGTIGPNNVPNGIVFIHGVGGTAKLNTVSACHYTTTEWGSAGIMVYDPVTSGIVIEQNQVSDCDAGVSLAMNANNVIVKLNNLHNNGNGVQLENGALNNSVLNNTIVANVNGVSLNDAIGAGNKVENNNISLNTTAGLENLSTLLVDASPNWWGDASGPKNSPKNTCGTGNQVIGNVEFIPWYKDAAMTLLNTPSGPSEVLPLAIISSTVECESSATAPTLPIVKDACGAVLTPTGPVILPTTPVSCNGTKTYTYTYTDILGHQLVWTYTYNIVRTTAPAESGTPVSQTGGIVQCTSAAIAPTTLPVVKDVCGNTLEPIGTPVVGGTYAGCEGTYTYTYNYKDCADLTFAWTYSYTIDHTTAPIVPADGASTVQCLTSATTPTPPSGITDVCGASVLAVLASTIDVPSTLTCEGTRTYTYTYTDCAGLVSSWKYIYTIDHTTSPVEVGTPVAIASTVECESNALPPTSLPAVQDVCGNVLTPGAPIKQVSFTNKFDDAVALGATAAPGIWYTDRYNPAGFASSSFGGDNRLKQSIAASDYQGSGSFYNTQGRSYDLGTSTNAMEVKLYIPADWATSNKRMAGLWGVAANASNAVSGYPIVEFTSDGNNPRFRAYDNGTWVNMGIPAGFSYPGWVTLKIRLLPSGEFLLSAGTLNYVTTGLAPDASVRLKSVILQGHNYDPSNTSNGVTYDIYWDDFTWNDTYSAIACEGAITYTYDYADCAGLPYSWTYTYTIDHVTAPVVPADGASPVECLTSAVAPALPAVTDICGTVLTPELVSTVDSPSTLTCGGTRTYNYKYTDCSGLVTNWKYVYTIQHTTAPAEVGGPVSTSGGTKECISAATAPTTLPVVKDVCGNILSPTVTSPVIGGTYTSCKGTYTYTYNYLDCAGLTFAWTYSYTIDHTTAPVVPTAGASTVACASLAVAPLAASDQQQLSFANYVLDNNSSVGQSFTCSKSGKLTKLDVSIYQLSGTPTFALEIYQGDGIGGTKLCSIPGLTLSGTGWQTLNIPANLAPALTSGSQYTFWLTGYALNTVRFMVGGNTYAGGQSYDLPPLANYPDYDLMFKTYTEPVVTDVCGNVIIPTLVVSSTPACQGNIVYTYTYTDCSGLSNDWVYTYTIAPVDFVMPSNTTATVACVSSIVVPTPPTVYDACGNLLVPVAGTTPTAPTCEGTMVYSWTYTDCANNSHVWSHTVTIEREDFTMPVNGSLTVACASLVVAPTLPVVKDNCQNVLTPTGPVISAIPACDGEVTYTYTYTDCEGNSHNWVFTYTIDDNIAPTITSTPADITVNMNTACTATGVNLGILLASDNCAGSVTITNDAPSAFPAGETIVTWTVKDCANNMVTSTQKVTIVGNTISGTLTYNNLTHTPMNRVKLGLYDSSNAQVGVDVTTAEGTGAYSFSNLCAGTYTIKVKENLKDVGGVNSTDAAAVNLWGTSGGTIQFVQFLAGDVETVGGNLYINNQDALRIQKYFVYGAGLWPFQRASWSYWKKDVTISANGSTPANFNVTVSGANVSNFDLLGMCTGDFNGSLIPTTLKSATYPMELNNNSTINAVANQEFELPLRAASAMQVGAISMILQIPSGMVNVQNILVNGSTVAPDWAVNGDELRIGWYSSTPVNVQENGNLLTLKLKSTSAFSIGQMMEFALKSDPLNELADGKSQEIKGAKLLVALVGNGVTGIHNPTDNSGLSLSNYPNPFKGNTTIDYQLPENGKVTIQVYNSLGQLVKSLVDGNQNAGNYSIRMDGNNLMPGIYIAKLRLTNLKVDMTGTVKLSVLK